jgi:hypothetical protein
MFKRNLLIQSGTDPLLTPGQSVRCMRNRAIPSVPSRDRALTGSEAGISLEHRLALAEGAAAKAKVPAHKTLERVATIVTPETLDFERKGPGRPGLPDALLPIAAKSDRPASRSPPATAACAHPPCHGAPRSCQRRPSARS